MEDQATTNPVPYEVTLEPHNQRWLFALDIPTKIPKRALLTEQMQLLNDRPVHSVYRYHLSSALNYQYDVNTVINLETALTVPANTAPKTRQFVKQLKIKNYTEISFITAVLNHFKNEAFYYTRKPPKLYSDHTDEFLFETRRGYCVHYASAFAIMMRLANIPARVVSGYQGGEVNPFSKNLIVRQSDAHAWVEVWLKNQGWVRFDPTSIIPDHRVEHTEDILQRQSRNQQAKFLLEKGWLSHNLRKVRLAFDAVQSRWNSWVVGYDHQRQTNFFSFLGIDHFSIVHIGLLMATSMAVAFFILGLLLFRRQKKPEQPILMLYELFCRKLARCGFEKQASETASAYAQRIITKRADLECDVVRINKLYNQLRYAHHAPKDLIGEFKALIQNFRPSHQ